LTLLTLQTDINTLGNHLLELPLEVRLSIYNYALDTGILDPVTKSRVHVVDRRWDLCQAVRKNDYSFVSANARSATLAQTCTQVRDEIETCLSKPSFKFVSPYAFVEFLAWDAGIGLNKVNLSTLEAATGVSVVIDGRYSGFHPLECLTDILTRPLTVKIIDEKGNSRRELAEAKIL
jgi:hypothetical protein